MTEVKFDKEIKELKKQSKPKKSIPINQPPKQTAVTRDRIVNETNNSYFEGEIPMELQGGLKNAVIYGLSYPCTKNRRKMAMNLHTSKFTNKYLDKYMCIDMVAGLDDHSKFLLTYGMNFVDAFMTQETNAVPRAANIQKEDDQQNL